MSTSRPVFDAAVIEEFAERLLAKASSIAVTTAFTWGLLTGLGTLIVLVQMNRGNASLAFDLAGLAALVSGFFGYLHGREKAFQLRLQAQNALCQVQIEKNTRSRPQAETILAATS